MPHYHYDGEEYCEDCLSEFIDPRSHKVDIDYGEQDSPANCCQCHQPLDYRLTSDGVNYVIEKLKEAIDNGIDWTVYDCYNGTYYDGSPHCAILRDWAQDVSNYCLTDDQKEIVDRFLEATEKNPNVA
jgi:mono/diheme cytochrome c family protein